MFTPITGYDVSNIMSLASIYRVIQLESEAQSESAYIYTHIHMHTTFNYQTEWISWIPIETAPSFCTASCEWEEGKQLKQLPLSGILQQR